MRGTIPPITLDVSKRLLIGKQQCMPTNLTETQTGMEVTERINFIGLQIPMIF